MGCGGGGSLCPGGGSDAHIGILETINKTITAGTIPTWDHFYTDDTSVFGTDTGAPGAQALTIVAPAGGLVIATCDLHYNLTTWNGNIILGGFGITTVGAFQAPAPSGTPNTQTGQAVAWGGQAGSFQAFVLMSPVGGGSHTLDSARLVVQLWTNVPTLTHVF